MAGPLNITLKLLAPARVVVVVRACRPYKAAVGAKLTGGNKYSADVEDIMKGLWMDDGASVPYETEYGKELQVRSPGSGWMCFISLRMVLVTPGMPRWTGMAASRWTRRCTLKTSAFVLTQIFSRDAPMSFWSSLA